MLRNVLPVIVILFLRLSSYVINRPKAHAACRIRSARKLLLYYERIIAAKISENWREYRSRTAEIFAGYRFPQLWLRRQPTKEVTISHAGP